ncbi:MAG: gliding motility-associated C-terminal domain-containing protein [Bacteroidota bacterium]
MPINKLKFLTFLLLLFTNVQAFAQVVNGSLGDPVVSQDFGTVSNPVPVSTNYNYTSNTCPPDGSYTLATATYGCFGNNWHTVTHDHTGNAGGYMMIVNADETANKEFFKQRTGTGALCENTTYEFSAYIMNLIVPKDGQAIKPNISFVIEDLDGMQLNVPYNAIIPESVSADGWAKYGITFRTPAGVNEVVIKMINIAPGGNGNDLLLDDIAFRAYGETIQAGFDNDVSITDSPVCEGDPYSFTITAKVPASYSDASLQWQLNLNDGNGWKDIQEDGAHGLTYSITKPSAVKGVYQYRLSVGEAGNTNSQCRINSNAVTINVTSYPVVANIPPRVVCEGDPIILTATGGATYKWTGPGITSTQNPLVIQVASAANEGAYHVDVISAAGCITPKDVTVTVNAKPVINISGTQTICAGSSTQITASATDGVTYSWSPAIGLSDPNLATPFASPSISTLYTVTVTNVNNCTSTNTVQVNVLPLPVAYAGDDKMIFEGQVTKLDGSATGDIATYTWSPADYLDDPHSLTPTANPPHDITYTLTVTSGNNCGESKDKVFVRVYEKIVIPSSFTPNNDGVNDLWNIEALNTYSDGMISIYNRGGKRVYQSRGYGKPWDGKFNGDSLPTGTYYYVIDLKNGTPALSGWVLILR